MATPLLPQTAPVDPLNLVTYKSLLSLVNGNGSTRVLKLSSLSPASQYHLESLLRYGEVGEINSAIANSPKAKDSPEQRSFTLYKQLPPELRIAIWKEYIRSHPRRLILSTSTSRRLRCVERESPVPVQLQVNSEIRSNSFKIHGFVELKTGGRDSGLFLNPELDMLVLDQMYAIDITPQWLEEAASECQILHKIRSIAISEDHYYFFIFMDSFKEYSNLELVFIIIDSGPQRRDWGTAEEARVSERNEIMFENMDTDGHPKKPSYCWVPRLHIPSGQFESHRHGYLKGLYKRMARENGITPQIRFVKTIKCMD